MTTSTFKCFKGHLVDLADSPMWFNVYANYFHVAVDVMTWKYVNGHGWKVNLGPSVPRPIWFQMAHNEFTYHYNHIRDTFICFHMACNMLTHGYWVRNIRSRSSMGQRSQIEAGLSVFSDSSWYQTHTDLWIDQRLWNWVIWINQSINQAINQLNFYSANIPGEVRLMARQPNQWPLPCSVACKHTCIQFWGRKMLRNVNLFRVDSVYR